MNLTEYLGEWTKVMDERELLKVMSQLNTLYGTTLISPNKKDVFKAFTLCPYNNLKVIMLGMDPYPQKNVATGILFGNNLEEPGATLSLSPSLQILKEGVIDYTIPHGNIVFDNTLESWAKQGVLMLNSALTVEVNKIGSHTQLWRLFMSRLLQNLSINNPGLIYVLFGKQAQTFIPYINKANYLISCNHPAYHARNGTPMDTGIFKEVNRILQQTNNDSVQWYQEIN